MAHKLWKKSTTNTTSLYGRSNGIGGYRNKATNNTTSVNSSSNKTNSDKSKLNTDSKEQKNYKKPETNTVHNGSVWNYKLNRFVEMGSHEKDNGHTSVVDLEKKRAMSLSVASENAKKLNSIDKESKNTDNIVSLIESNINIEHYEHGLPEAKTNIVEIKSICTVNATKETVTTKHSLLEEIKKNASSGKEISQNILDAKKASIEALRKAKRFTNDEEVAEICNTTVNGLNKLSCAAIANRLLRHSFGKIYESGWLDKCKTIEKGRHELVERKLTNAEKRIRILKTINNVLGKTMYSSKKPVIPEQIDNWAKNLGVNSEINMKSIKKIFNAGDFRQNPAIKSIAVALEKYNK